MGPVNKKREKQAVKIEQNNNDNQVKTEKKMK
jgi:hypothetical protein